MTARMHSRADDAPDDDTGATSPLSHLRVPTPTVFAAIELLQTSAPDPSGLSDAEQQALEVLYRAYMPLVRDTIYPLIASLPDTEDVTQQVFLGLPRALRRYRQGNFPGWLRQVAARTALMRLRESRRAKARLDEAALALRDDRGWHVALHGDEEAGLDERFERMRRAFYALPAPLREVVFLRAIVGLTHQEIAEWLEITVGASYTRYCRALQQVRQTMGVAHD